MSQTGGGGGVSDASQGFRLQPRAPKPSHALSRKGCPGGVHLNGCLPHTCIYMPKKLSDDYILKKPLFQNSGRFPPFSLAAATTACPRFQDGQRLAARPYCLQGILTTSPEYVPLSTTTRPCGRIWWRYRRGHQRRWQIGRRLLIRRFPRHRKLRRPVRC